MKNVERIIEYVSCYVGFGIGEGSNSNLAAHDPVHVLLSARNSRWCIETTTLLLDGTNDLALTIWHQKITCHGCLSSQATIAIESLVTHVPRHLSLTVPENQTRIWVTQCQQILVVAPKVVRSIRA